MIEDRRFTCFVCKQTFEVDGTWTDKDREVEAQRVFGFVPADPALVCEDCYAAALKFLQEEGRIQGGTPS